MKRLFSILMSVALLVGLVGCGESLQEFDVKESYKVDDKVKVEFKSMLFADEIEPTNLNDEYYYWFTDEKDTTMINVQFYVENLTSKKIDLEDFIEGKIVVDEEELDYDFCMEINDFTEIDDSSKLKAYEKSVAHLMFYIDKDILKKYTKKDSQKSLKLELTLGEETYGLNVKEREAKVKKLKLDKTISLDNMDIKIVSAHTSPIIPVLNPTEESSFYMVEDDNKEYAGMYVEITNTGKDTLNLTKDIYVSIDVQGNDVYTWNDMLNQNLDEFEENENIEPNTTRTILFFGEVDASYEKVKYIMNIYVEGKPYSYTYSV